MSDQSAVFDALPVEERTGLDCASTETTTDEDGRTVPLMHACGHDLHVAALLGAAGAMAAHQEAWSGTFIALFRPGEEIAAGARSMVDDGLIEKVPAPEVVLGQHVMTHEAGTIGTKAGPILSAGDSIEITLHGSGAHGSMPHLSVDPVVLASTIVMRLQTVVSREIPPSSFAVLTVGSIQAGSKSNIIPATATLLLNMRTYDEDVRSTMITALERIVRGECEAAGCPQEPEFRYYDQYPLTHNDDDVSAKVTEALRAQFGDAVFEQSPQTASEDFSIVPSAFGVPYTYLDGRRRLEGPPREGRVQRRSRGPDRPQPLVVLLPGHRSDPRVRHQGAPGGRAGLAGLTRSPTRPQLRSPSALMGCEGAASSVRVEESLIGRRHCAGADGPGTRTI